LIANSFFLIRYIEQWGKGTNKIVEWCKGHGLKEPDFEEKAGSFVVRFQAPEDILDLVPDKRKLNLKELGLNDRQIKALRIMINQKEKITVRRYAESFNVSEKTAKRDLKKLMELKLIRKKGVKKGAYFEAL